MVKTAIVDDTDPNIVYGTGWTRLPRAYSELTNEFNSTLHYVSTNGATMTYTFRGTGITVYGTLSKPETYGTPGSTYSIDGGTLYRFNSTGDVVNTGDPGVTFSHIPFYRSPTLNYGDHTIVVRVDNVDDSVARRYFFDFFTVQGVQDDDNAQGSGAANGPGFTIVDDRDSRVSLSATGWATSGSGTSTDYEGTTSTTPKGRNGVATFTFTGTDIAVYGRIHDSYGPYDIAEFIVDAGTPDQVTRSASYEGMTTDRRHQPLLVLSGLKEEQHKIQVTAFGDRAPPWYLDYFVYGTTRASNGGGSVNAPTTVADSGSGDGGVDVGVGEGEGTGTSSGSSAGSGSVVTTRFTSNGVIMTQTVSVLGVDFPHQDGPQGSNSGNGDNSSSNNSSSITTKSSKNAATIAGATIGAVALLSLLVFLFLYWARKRRLRLQKEMGGDYVPYQDPSEDEKGPRRYVDTGSLGREASMSTRASGGGVGGGVGGGGGGGNMEMVDGVRQQVQRPSRLPPAFGEKVRPAPGTGAVVCFSDGETLTRNGGQTTVVRSLITSYPTTGSEESDPALSAALLSHSSVPPNTESIPATVPNVVIDSSGDGSRERLIWRNEGGSSAVAVVRRQGSIKYPQQSNTTNQLHHPGMMIAFNSSSPNQQQQQLIPPQVAFVRQTRGQGSSVPSMTGEEDGLGFGRELDAGIRLDPMQFNMTAPELLPPSYSATTTYRR
ncbi:hypothetical protein FRB91_010287 [Serendipita sp. 411]|nr:hypothetical protein FRC18_003325 [Serendipita sp. 400]KAG8858137.1 hypothetical protein FRB91_010287 [Serendipita sp. 411]